jgi:hypothetical protein
LILGGMLERLANLDTIASAAASRPEAGWRAPDPRVWDGVTRIELRVAAR